MPTSPAEPPDVALIGRVMRGDHAAHRAFVDRATPVIRARIRQKTGGRGVGMYGIDDLTQETFERLFRDECRLLSQWQPERASLLGYCSVVAGSVVHDRIKAYRPTASEVPELLDPRPDSAQLAEDRENLRQLYDCLKQSLSPTGWVVFMALYAEGCSPTELARQYGRTRAWVDDWHYKIRQCAEDCRARHGEDAT